MKKVLGSIAVAGLLASSAFAAPSLSAKNMGDFLIAPAFFAYGDFETEVKLVNTSVDHSVVVRGVVRDSVASNEVDFTILLSPGDVWNATIKDNGEGAVLYSDDDSNYGLYTRLTDKTSALEVNLPSRYNNALNFKHGYVEFYPVVAYDENGKKVVLKDSAQNVEVFNVNHGTNTQVNGVQYGYKSPDVRNYLTLESVDKNAIAQRFENFLNANNTIDAKYGITDGAEKSVPNVLAGEVTVTSNTVNAAMTLPMVAVADASLENIALMDTSTVLPGSNTQAGAYLQDVAGVEALLNANSINAFYDNNGQNNNLLFTFWNDQKADQSRLMRVDVRNYHECMCDCIEPAVIQTVELEDCPTCTPAEVVAQKVDIISGNTAATTPTATTKVYCAYRVVNEFSSVPMANLISTTYKCDSNENWSKGWVRLHSITHDGNSQAIIPTQMSAENVNGQWSFNWNYVSSN